MRETSNGWPTERAVRLIPGSAGWTEGRPVRSAGAGISRTAVSARRDSEIGNRKEDLQMSLTKKLSMSIIMAAAVAAMAAFAGVAHGHDPEQCADIPAHNPY